MSIDFKLNKFGDILFKYSDREQTSFQFDFFTSPTNGLLFNFYIDSYVSEGFLPDLDPMFSFQFYIDEPDYNKEILTISNEEYLYQQIRIRLDSALGSIKNNENIGSELDRYRHTILNPNKIKNEYLNIKECIARAIADILPNATIEVFAKDTIYTDFTNSLIVSISKGEINYYYYL